MSSKDSKNMTNVIFTHLDVYLGPNAHFFNRKFDSKKKKVKAEVKVKVKVR